MLIEKKFSRLYTALSTKLGTSFNNNDKQLFHSAVTIATKIYSDYNELLMDLLNKYGYLIGEQADASRMKFY
jgi:hypothetical protein